MEKVDCIVAGAGVVGLAIAREAARRGWETLILEAADAIGTETSSRNSEVIHAGIYYPAGSLKAKLCVEGRDKLYTYARERGIAHRRCGKLIVATQEGQQATLAEIASKAKACGVTDLEMLSGEKAREMEPALSCTSALLSPSTGIIDSHGLMLSLLGEAEENGAALALNTSVVSARAEAQAIVVQARDTTTGEEMEIAATRLFNAAGLGANRLARSIDGLDPRHIPPLNYARGNYFSLAHRPVFSHLIYPVPEPGGLGVHLTLDLNGGMRFGPDVEWVDTIDYRVDPRRADHFYGEIRKYWPDLADGGLQPAYSGIRPKLAGPGQPNADFVIEGGETHGVAGLVNLFGIESPGLTSCLAIAAHAVALAQ
ncbi:L-2-hydroxyglutarate oxidase LhgO [Pseudaminobacter salicylatoxidans]|uniref:L-2-hydroxyglutarate oxidase LhgO n=1 Tax=Pseudaminobacter salicylatoxidans TaxID=93369 RepID=A0A316CQB7_PSESE|nr:NAD(P)/FAD-dependent oxidoreductase [Pseudaminobacter salicylatoxidans]PWJ84394.1 L-2-hydroxyglutarate oxidase LhgO [Pseudaminobacter salicylatoxidans]